MSVEIDFLAVGDGEKSGDAIALRFGNFSSPDTQAVVVIDGGFTDDGDKLVNHIRTHYCTSQVDIAVLTHPDADHANGLHAVLEKLVVRQVWMHTPWADHYALGDLFQSGRVTDTSVRESLRRSLEAAHSVWSLANQKGVQVIEPFAGVSAYSDAIQVLGPTRDFYEAQLLNFRGTPEPKPQRLLASFATSIREAERDPIESWDFETLQDGEGTTAENETSAIIRLTWEGQEFLFTGDAGELALKDVLQRVGARQYKVIQVPHHGSRRNVGPTVLDQLVGPRVANGIQNGPTAYVSASKSGTPKHPNQRVINAFIRRGARVYATRGKNLWHHYNAPHRDGWVTASQQQFVEELEDDS